MEHIPYAIDSLRKWQVPHGFPKLVPASRSDEEFYLWLVRSWKTALSAIHSLGYAHQDIKPGNVRIKINGYNRDNLGLPSLTLSQLSICLIDFGHSNVIAGMAGNTDNMRLLATEEKARQKAAKENKKLAKTGKKCAENEEDEEDSENPGGTPFFASHMWLPKTNVWKEMRVTTRENFSIANSLLEFMLLDAGHENRFWHYRRHQDNMKTLGSLFASSEHASSGSWLRYWMEHADTYMHKDKLETCPFHTTMCMKLRERWSQKADLICQLDNALELGDLTPKKPAPKKRKKGKT